MENFMPLKNISIPAKNIKFEKWMTNGLLRSSQKLHKLYRKQLNKNKQVEAHKKYITFRNMYNKLRQRAKKRILL